MNQAIDERRAPGTPGPSPCPTRSLAARRRGARRQAWLIGLGVLLLYLGGLLVAR